MDAFEATSVFTKVLLTIVTGPVLYLFVNTLVSFTKQNQKRYWKAQSWSGIRDELFAGFRAKLRTFRQIRDMAGAGYKKFSKKNLTFAVPFIGSEPWLVLPPTVIKEILNKSDAEVDAHVIHEEQTHLGYTMGPKGVYISDVDIHFDVVRRQLTRKLPLLTGDVHDELHRGFEDYFGTDTDTTKTLKVYPICMKIVTRAANRVFAGTELCRSEAFLEHSRLYSQHIFGGAALIQLIPKTLRPILAPLITYPNRKNERICKEISIPIVKERLRHTFQKQKDPSYDWTPPVDTLQWLIEDCIKIGNPIELDPDLLALRLLELNMVAIHTTSLTITFAILNIYSSPRMQEWVDGLREECTRVLAKHDGQWTKDAINELLRVDSAIRESMRFSDLGWLALNRLVTAPKGISFSHDIHVPQGVRICVASSSIHKDADYYPSPQEFNAFRFSQPRETHMASSSASTKLLDLKNTSLVTTSDEFLSFGHGRHACPGRFFAAQEMKLMLAYLVMNYDVEPIGAERPDDLIVGGAMIPSGETQIRFRRRKA